MGATFEDLLDSMPAMAEAVNGFDSEDTQRRALDALLDAFFGHEPEVRDAAPEDERTESTDDERPDSPNGKAANETSLAGWEKEIYKGLPDDHDVSSGTRDQQAVWGAVVLRQQGRESTPETIREVVRKRLGVSPESRSNLSGRLGRLTPKYLSRDDRGEGRGYTYTPTRRALDIFKASGGD